MPRKKATAALASTNGDPTPGTSSPSSFATPLYSGPGDDTLGDTSSISHSALPGRNRSGSASGSVTGVTAGVQLGGTFTQSIQRQMTTEGIEQFELPRAVVTRVAKAELPDNVQIRKDAILAISKSATIFISYLAAVSDELAKQGSRKMISTADVIDGLALMEFPKPLREKLKVELKAYRSLLDQSKKDKDKPAASGGANLTEGGGEVEEEEEEDEEGDGDEAEDAGDEEDEGRKIIGSTQEAGSLGLLGGEDEETEQKLVEEGADDGEEEDEAMGEEES